MGEVTIRMISNSTTGKRDIYIEYESEDDALPHEHEKEHKGIIEQLMGKGILKPNELGEVKVGRVQANPTAETPNEAPAAKQAQGNQG
jgi:hypothetical protein